MIRNLQRDSDLAEDGLVPASLASFRAPSVLPGRARFIVLILICLLCDHTLLAATFTWNGGGGNVNWSTAGNWTGGTPTSATTTDLVFAGVTNTGTAGTPLNQNIATPFVLNTITFNAAGGTFFLGGNSLQFNGATDTITQSSSSAESIANVIDPTGKSGNGVETINLAGNGTGIVTLSGNIVVGNGQRDYAITKTGTSTFVLSGNNTYGSATTVSAGILNIQSANALGGTGNGTTVSSGATLQIQGGITTAAEGLTINGTGATGQNGALVNVSGTNDYAGLITLGSASTISSDSGTLNLTNAGTITGATRTLTLTGSGDGSVTSIIGTTTGGVTKNGTGTWTLAGANTYTGATTVNAGTLLVNGSTAAGSAVTVNSGGTLGGTGTVNGTVTTAGTGIIDAGPQGTAGTSGAVGTLRTGVLTLAGTSTFHVDAFGISAANWDQLVVNGTATLGSAQFSLSIATAGLNFATGATYVLIDATAITGTFSNATEGSIVSVNGYDFTAHYDTAAGNFDLIAIPEPSTWVAAALTLLAIGFTQRRKVMATLAKASTKV